MTSRSNLSFHFISLPAAKKAEYAALEIVLASGSGWTKTMHDVHTRDLL